MPLLLTQEDLRPLVSDPGAAEGAFQAVEAAYREYQLGAAKHYAGVSLPLSGEQGSLRILPGATPATGASVRFYPMASRSDNPDSAVNLLFDGHDGHLLAMLSGDDLNLFRTAVPAGIGCRHLAPAGARIFGMLGSGRQSRGQLVAARHALPALEQVRVFSPNPVHRAAFAREMGDRLQLPIEPCDDPRAVVDGADVVGVTSNARQPVLETDWVKPGALVVSIASGQLPADLVARSRVIVSGMNEVVGAGRREPYKSMIAAGTYSPDRIAAEIGEVLLGVKPGRGRDDETVIYEMPGMSFWDVAVVRWAYNWAVANDVGREFHLTSMG